MSYELALKVPSRNQKTEVGGQKTDLICPAPYAVSREPYACHIQHPVSRIQDQASDPLTPHQ